MGVWDDVDGIGGVIEVDGSGGGSEGDKRVVGSDLKFEWFVLVLGIGADVLA